MKRTIFCIVLALLLLQALSLPARGADYDGSIHPDLLIPALKTFFFGAEGDYSAVNARDNGAVSLGLLQWHGRRALELVRKAVSADPAAARQLLGRALCDEVQSEGANWDRRTLDDAEAAAVSALLASPAGRQAQDELARADISVYLDAAWRAGMRTDATVFYYATIYNQFGVGGAKTYLEHIRAAMGVGEDALFYDLDELHAAVHAVPSYGTRHLGQRDKTYAFILSLGWWTPGQREGASGSGAPEAPRGGADQAATAPETDIHFRCVRQRRLYHAVA